MSHARFGVGSLPCLSSVSGVLWTRADFRRPCRAPIRTHGPLVRALRRRSGCDRWIRGPSRRFRGRLIRREYRRTHFGDDLSWGRRSHVVLLSGIRFGGSAPDAEEGRPGGISGCSQRSRCLPSLASHRLSLRRSDRIIQVRQRPGKGSVPCERIDNLCCAPCTESSAVPSTLLTWPTLRPPTPRLNNWVSITSG